jgi:flap endonuclease-1
MGVKKILKLIESKIEEQKKKGEMTSKPVEYKKIEDYSNKWIVIDANLALYKIMIAIRGSGDIVNSRGKVVSHLHALFFKVMNLINNGIKPIFVFDGKPPKIKDDTLEERRRLKEQAFMELEQLLEEEEIDEEEKKKLMKRTLTLKWTEIEDCMILLKLMGIPYIQAVGEADPQCVGFTLSKKYDVYGVASEDGDILAFGAKYLLKNFSNTKTIQEYNLEEILKLLGLKTHKQYIELCVLLGTDYCIQTIKNLGAEKALNLIIEHDNLENVVKYLYTKKKYEIPKDYLEKAIEAREYFINPLIYNVDEMNIEIMKPDTIQLEEFMIKEHEFIERKQLHMNIIRLKEKYNEYIKKQKK